MSRDSPWHAVVDDEEGVSKALRRLLQSAGLAVATFAGGGGFLDSPQTHQWRFAVRRHLRRPRTHAIYHTS
jgi:FixJ family two-component response regulator